MRQEVWITLRLPIDVDLGARYHRDDVLDSRAQGQGARGSKHFTNEIVSVRIRSLSPEKILGGNFVRVLTRTWM